MKIYLVEFNECDYDQYHSFVVVAENKQKAIEFLQKKHPEGEGLMDGYVDWKGGYKVREIKPNEYSKTTIILNQK